MIGLGRMGANLVRRLMRDGHDCVVYDVSKPTRSTSSAARARPARLRSRSSSRSSAKPRAVWIMVPAAFVDATIDEAASPHLEPGDIIIDGGNSYYRDDIDRAARAQAERASTTSTVGTSGGVFGLERGFCLMIGGEDDVVAPPRPDLHDASRRASTPRRARPGRTGDPSTAEQGYLHCGPNGAGHFVKMVHNGIEYGIMAAYAEGLNILQHANVGTAQREADAETAPLRDPQYYQYDLDLPEVAEVWRRGSVIASWLLDLTAHALSQIPTSPTSRAGCPTPARAAGPIARRDRRGRARRRAERGAVRRASRRAASADFADQLLSAMRKEFGGHDEKLDQTIGESKSVADADPLRRARVLRHVRRPRAQEDLPRALRDGEARHARRAGDRRGVVAVDGRAISSTRAARQHRRARRRGRRRRRVRQAHRASMRYVDGDYSDASTFTKLKKELGERAGARRTTSRSRRACSRPVVEGLGSSGCADERARHRREAVRPRPRVGAGAQPRAALGVPRAERSSASTTTSARRRSQNILYFRFANSFLEPIWNRNYVRERADHDGRGLRRAGPRRVLRGGRRAARRHRRTTCSRSSRCSRWSRRSGPGVEELRDEQGEGVRGDATRSSPTTSCAGSSRATATSRASRPTPTSRRSPRCACTSTRGAGPACRSTSAPARTCRSTCTEVRVELHRPPQQVFAEYEQLPHDTNYLRFQLDPQHRDRDRARGRRPPGDGFMGDRRRAVPLQRRIPGEEPPYERLLGDAMRRRDAAVRPRGRRRGVVAGRRQRAHRPRPGDPLQGPHVGSRGAGPL